MYSKGALSGESPALCRRRRTLGPWAGGQQAPGGQSVRRQKNMADTHLDFLLCIVSYLAPNCASLSLDTGQDFLVQHLPDFEPRNLGSRPLPLTKAPDPLTSQRISLDPKGRTVSAKALKKGKAPRPHPLRSEPGEDAAQALGACWPPCRHTRFCFKHRAGRRSDLCRSFRAAKPDQHLKETVLNTEGRYLDNA